MIDGWIKLNRSICNSAVFSDAEVLRLWIWLLCNAAYEEQKLLYCGKVIHLKKGELIIGRKLLAKKLHTKESKIYRALKLLQELGNISIQTNNKYSIATIVNWAKYQEDFKKANSRATAEQQQSNSRFDKQIVNGYSCLRFVNDKNEQQNNSCNTNNDNGLGNIKNQSRTTRQQQDNNGATAEQQQDNTYKEIKEGKKEYIKGEEAMKTPPPTLEEVRAFCFDRSSIVDPARFYNFYQKRGWNSVGDWRLKIEEWENNKYSAQDRERVRKLADYRSCEDTESSGIVLDDFFENM